MARGKRRRPKRRPPRAVNRRVHAARRAGERYGFGRHDVAVMEAAIRDGRSWPVRKGATKATSVHLVMHEDTPVAVVYDRRQHVIATVLPRHEAEAAHLAIFGSADTPRP